MNWTFYLHILQRRAFFIFKVFFFNYSFMFLELQFHYESLWWLQIVFDQGENEVTSELKIGFT